MISDVISAIPTHELALFTMGGLALNFAPGPDVFFATASGLQGGPRIGALAGLGVGFGVIMHVTMAVLGLSALLAAIPGALDVIRWVGAAYLIWIAVKAWRAAGSATTASGAMSAQSALWRGFLSNALNPKPVLFMMSFLPQFTDPAYGPIWQQVAILGTIFTVTGTLVTMGYGVLAGVLQRGIGAGMEVMNRVAAVMFAGLAAKLVMS